MTNNDQRQSAPGLLKRFERHFLITLVIVVLVFFILSIYAHTGDLVRAFSRFNFLYIPLILILASGNYIMRFFRWEYYLKTLDISIDRKDSFIVFMSGLTMSITPGKLGELLKSYLLKKLDDIPVSKSAPIVFAERFTDFTALVVLCVSGVLIFHSGTIVLLISLGIILIFLFILGNRSLALKIISLTGNIRFLKNVSSRLVETYTNTQALLQQWQLLAGTLIGVFSWSFECMAFYFVFKGFQAAFPLFPAFFIYSFSTIAGAITMSPGGVGLTEFSITFFLVSNGIPKAIGVAATFIIRVCTLWFAVIIGSLFLFLFRKRFQGVEEYMNGQNK